MPSARSNRLGRLICRLLETTAAAGVLAIFLAAIWHADDFVAGLGWIEMVLLIPIYIALVASMIGLSIYWLERFTKPFSIHHIRRPMIAFFTAIGLVAWGWFPDLVMPWLPTDVLPDSSYSIRYQLQWLLTFPSLLLTWLMYKAAVAALARWTGAADSRNAEERMSASRELLVWAALAFGFSVHAAGTILLDPMPHEWDVFLASVAAAATLYVAVNGLLKRRIPAAALHGRH